MRGQLCIWASRKAACCEQVEQAAKVLGAAQRKIPPASADFLVVTAAQRCALCRARTSFTISARARLAASGGVLQGTGGGLCLGCTRAAVGSANDQLVRHLTRSRTGLGYADKHNRECPCKQGILCRAALSRFSGVSASRPAACAVTGRNPGLYGEIMPGARTGLTGTTKLRLDGLKTRISRAAWWTITNYAA